MTPKELSDNLEFIAALQMLSILVSRNALAESEAELVRKELKRRLRPTIF